MDIKINGTTIKPTAMYQVIGRLFNADNQMQVHLPECYALVESRDDALEWIEDYIYDEVCMLIKWGPDIANISVDFDGDITPWKRSTVENIDQVNLSWVVHGIVSFKWIREFRIVKCFVHSTNNSGVSFK
jgi:hypothetical protein